MFFFLTTNMVDQICAGIENLSLEEYEAFCPRQYRYVLGIDVGIVNLGLCLVSLNRDYSFREVIFIDKLNL